MERCEECSFDYDEIARDEIPGALRALGLQYRDMLGDRDDDLLRAHPLPETWSALEYACHVRDVFTVQRERVLLALAEERPAFPSMRREERVTEERYNEQQPTQVGREITVAAESLAAALESLDEDAWSRTGIYNWPTTRVRTVEWIGRHTIHEGKHHMQDIDHLSGRQLVLDQVNLVVHDMEATLTFYRRLGLAIPDDSVWRTPTGAHHAEVTMPNGPTLEFDSVELARSYHAGWREPEGGGSRGVLGFKLRSRNAVDDRYADLIGAGYPGRQPPYDAFWGARYAIVQDPDGNDVGLMSPSDPGRRSGPPAV